MFVHFWLMASCRFRAPSWGRFKLSWPHLGPVLGRQGHVWDRPEPVQGPSRVRLGLNLGLFRELLGPFWGRLGLSWRRLGTDSTPILPASAPSRCLTGACRFGVGAQDGHLVSSWAVLGCFGPPEGRLGVLRDAPGRSGSVFRPTGVRKNNKNHGFS